MPKGWFHIPGVQEGDRTLEQQSLGLGPLFAEIEGRTVADFGCAEGLLAIDLAIKGAIRVDAFEIIPGMVQIGQSLAAGKPVTFHNVNLNDFADWRRRHQAAVLAKYDVVIMLAILHKLRHPGELLEQAATLCRDLLIIRLPPRDAPVIVDPRSLYQPFNVKIALRSDFTLERIERGLHDEWTGYFRRGIATPAATSIA